VLDVLEISANLVYFQDKISFIGLPLGGKKILFFNPSPLSFVCFSKTKVRPKTKQKSLLTFSSLIQCNFFEKNYFPLFNEFHIQSNPDIENRKKFS
jgi:hypothetical protein